jgi:hypothetical protein
MAVTTETTRWESIEDASRVSRIPVGLMQKLITSGLVAWKFRDGAIYVSLQDVSEVLARAFEKRGK